MSSASLGEIQDRFRPMGEANRRRFVRSFGGKVNWKNVFPIFSFPIHFTLLSSSLCLIAMLFNPKWFLLIGARSQEPFLLLNFPLHYVLEKTLPTLFLFFCYSLFPGLFFLLLIASRSLINCPVIADFAYLLGLDELFPCDDPFFLDCLETPDLASSSVVDWSSSSSPIISSSPHMSSSMSMSPGDTRRGERNQRLVSNRI